MEQGPRPKAWRKVACFKQAPNMFLADIDGVFGAHLHGMVVGNCWTDVNAFPCTEGLEV